MAVISNIVAAVALALRGESFKAPMGYILSLSCIAAFFSDLIYYSQLGIAERRMTIGRDKVQRSIRDVLVSALGTPDTAARCAAAEGIGRLCQV